jgi:hypothetical protein
MSIIHLLKLCDAFGVHTGRRRATVSTMLFNDGDKLDGLAVHGRDIGVNRLGRAIRDLSHMWPADLPWPADIPRPSPSPPAPTQNAEAEAVS